MTDLFFKSMVYISHFVTENKMPMMNFMNYHGQMWAWTELILLFSNTSSLNEADSCLFQTGILQQLKGLFSLEMARWITSVYGEFFDNIRQGYVTYDQFWTQN